MGWEDIFCFLAYAFSPYTLCLQEWAALKGLLMGV